MEKTNIRFFYNPKDDWEMNYNNQDFFEYNVERLRWCLIDADWSGGFSSCVDLETLEIKNSVEYYKLAMMSHAELMKMVRDNEWEWKGDDFEHMIEYLNFIAIHDPSFMYNTKVMNGDEYMSINTYKVPSEYRTGELRKAYLAGQADAEIGA